MCSDFSEVDDFIKIEPILENVFSMFDVGVQWAKDKALLLRKPSKRDPIGLKPTMSSYMFI